MHFKYQSYVILTWQTKQYHTYGTVISSSVPTSSRKICNPIFHYFITIYKYTE